MPSITHYYCYYPYLHVPLCLVLCLIAVCTCPAAKLPRARLMCLSIHWGNLGTKQTVIEGKVGETAQFTFVDRRQEMALRKFRQDLAQHIFKGTSELRQEYVY